MSSNDIKCKCNFCNKKISIMRFTCKFCDEIYCVNHQLPENHKCDIKNSSYYDKYKTLKNNNEYKAINTNRPDSNNSAF